MSYKLFTDYHLDSSIPCGDIIVSMLATIAAQDLIKISENTQAALVRKKASGQKLGASAKDIALVAQVRQLKASGASNQATARTFNLSPSIVAKYVSYD